MDIKFDGKKALVTGAGKGFGYAIATALAAGGAEVFALSRTQSDLDRLKAEVPAIHTECVDLTDWAKSHEVIEKVLQHHGPIHLLVNNAGICGGGLFGQISPEVIDEVLAINLKSYINVSQLITNKLREDKCPGAIVNLSSLGSKVGAPGAADYFASKGGVDSLTRAMAAELGPHNIRVNAVNPTMVLTPGFKHIPEENPEVSAGILARAPLSRIPEVEEVVNPILFLLSEKASMIHGVTLLIDGGYSAC